MQFWSPLDTSLGRFALFGLALASTAPYSLYPPSGTVGICPLGLFCFTVCVPNTLAFQLKLEDTAPIFRVPLSIFDVLRFLEEAMKLPVKFLSFFWNFPTGLRCLLSLASQPCLIWTFTWGLRSWGSCRGCLSPMSLERVPKLSANTYSRSHASWLGFSHPI